MVQLPLLPSCEGACYGNINKLLEDLTEERRNRCKDDEHALHVVRSEE